MSVTRWVFLSIAALLIALLARMPAAWVVAHSTDQFKGLIDIQNAKGTIWRGTADVKLAQGISIDQVSWQFHPLSLLTLSPSFTLSSEAPDLKGTVNIGFYPRSIEVRELQATATAKLVTAIEPRAGAFAPEGNFQFDAYELDCSRAGCEGMLNASWINAAVALSELRPLGDYQGIFHFKQASVHYELKTLKGTLRAAGKGSWEQGKSPTFTGELSAAPDQLPKVQGLMRLLGTPDERGVLRINR